MKRRLALVALAAVSIAADYAPLRPDGVLASSPAAAAARGGTAVALAVRGTDGSVWLSESGDPWRPLGAPSSGFTGDPALVSWSEGRLDLFVRGADDHLWQRFRPTAGSEWSAWIKPVGDDGVLASNPDVSSRGPGRLDLFVVGTDGQVYERFYEGPGWNGAWLPRGAPPGGLTGDPAVAASDSMRVDLFVRGADNDLWRQWYDGTKWTAWEQPVGFRATLTSSPRAVSGDQYQVVVFGRGTDGQVWSTEGNGSGSMSFRGWLRESTGSNPIIGRPAAAARGLSRIDVFVRGTDDRAYRFAYAPPPLGPAPDGPPAIAVSRPDPGPSSRANVS